MPELLLERPTHIPQADRYIRPPEAEVYGRSLSTIHRLGALMVRKSLAEAVRSPEADQARVEFFTSVEEGFGTDVELGGGLEVRDFDVRPVIDGRVMSKDLKTPISAMTESGLKCAVVTAEKDERFKPQLIRSHWDHENALQVDKMARSETGYNTRIVVSPFPEEAAAKTGSEYWRDIGYVPHLKRGFVQLYHFNGKEVISGSLSFDDSNKQRLREIFEQFGIQIPAGEVTDNWLKYALTATLAEEEAKALAGNFADNASGPKHANTTNTVDVTHQYKEMMNQVFDSSYMHVCESLFKGRQTAGARQLIFQLADKAGNFNKRYAQALYKMRSDTEKFSDDDSIVLHELLVYSTIEMMRALHLKSKELHVSDGSMKYFPAHLMSMDTAAFQNALGNFGASGARQGRTYSACGLSISLGEDMHEEGPQSAFGGQDIEAGLRTSLDRDKYGPLTFKCKNGHLNRRPKYSLIKQCRVKTCKNSVSC